METYIKKLDRQLNIDTYYQKLSADPTAQYMMEIKKFTGSMYNKELIDKKVKDFLISHHPQAARFYLLSKIRKPENPYRPIMASNCAPTKNISHFMNFFCNLVLPRFHLTVYQEHN